MRSGGKINSYAVSADGGSDCRKFGWNFTKTGFKPYLVINGVQIPLTICQSVNLITLQSALFQTLATAKVQALIHQVRPTSQLAGHGMAWFPGVLLLHKG